MHFLILKILFPSVCVTAVYEGESWTDATVTLSSALQDLTRSTVENSWTACKKKSTFINCEVESSPTIGPSQQKITW